MSFKLARSVPQADASMEIARTPIRKLLNACEGEGNHPQMAPMDIVYHEPSIAKTSGARWRSSAGDTLETKCEPNINTLEADYESVDQVKQLICKWSTNGPKEQSSANGLKAQFSVSGLKDQLAFLQKDFEFMSAAFKELQEDLKMHKSTTMTLSESIRNEVSEAVSHDMMAMGEVIRMQVNDVLSKDTMALSEIIGQQVNDALSQTVNAALSEVIRHEVKEVLSEKMAQHNEHAATLVEQKVKELSFDHWTQDLRSFCEEQRAQDVEKFTSSYADLADFLRKVDEERQRLAIRCEAKFQSVDEEKQQLAMKCELDINELRGRCEELTRALNEEIRHRDVKERVSRESDADFTAFSVEQTKKDLEEKIFKVESLLESDFHELKEGVARTAAQSSWFTEKMETMAMQLTQVEEKIAAMLKDGEHCFQPGLERTSKGSEHEIDIASNRLDKALKDHRKEKSLSSRRDVPSFVSLLNSSQKTSPRMQISNGFHSTAGPRMTDSKPEGAAPWNSIPESATPWKSEASVVVPLRSLESLVNMTRSRSPT